MGITLAAVLIASAGGGGGPVAHAPAGLFLGADAGAAMMIGLPQDPTRIAPAFDVRAGYAWRWGLTFQSRFDDFGVESPARVGPLMMLGLGARYSFPLVVMPYVEVDGGPIFDPQRVSGGIVVGTGLAIPLHRHVLVDVGIHDAIVETGGVRHIFGFGVGIALGFGSR